MVEKTSFSIDPIRVDEYKSIVEKKFRSWHEEEWSLVYSYDEFLEISHASFLAYIKYLLDHTSEEGIVDIEKAEEFSRQTAGEYYSEEKFNKAVAFVEGDHWHAYR